MARYRKRKRGKGKGKAYRVREKSEDSRWASGTATIGETDVNTEKHDILKKGKGFFV